MRTDSVLTVTLIVLAAGNVVVSTGCLFLEKQIHLASQPALAFSPASGIPVRHLATGAVHVQPSGPSKCTVVRYVKSDCPYCLREKSEWNSLASRASDLGCSLVGVVPTAASVLPRSAYGIGAAFQLDFVGMGWVAVAPPMATPTTMIFGGDGALLWEHVGELTDEEVASAVKVITSPKA
jgi:glutaredoxin